MKSKVLYQFVFSLIASISFSTTVYADDVVLFASYKSEEIKKNLSKTYEGLSDESKLDGLLQEQNYVEVLKHLWSEPDVSKRCAWLKKKVCEGHSILIFELAEDRYLQCQTLECYLTKVMPWMIAGAVRVQLDARCTMDPSVIAAADQLLLVYHQRILELVLEKFTLEQMEAYIMGHNDLFMSKNTIVQRKVFKPMLDTHYMPSPTWVFAHGMGSFLELENTIPESQFDAIRKKGALEILGMLN